MLIRQPNGKICMCDWTGKIERMNLTEDDYVEYCAAKAREYINNPDNIEHFGKLIERQKVTDEELKEMGSEKTLEELLKFVPRKPLHMQYISVNFETQGRCPSCGGVVVDGMGGTDDKCGRCNQLLSW